MEYTVKALGKLAGISSRTLRYYDEIELLKPTRINSSGYRIYGKREVDSLQQILFYRELDFSLEKIKEIIKSPSFEENKALLEHLDKLIIKRNQIDQLIYTLKKTIEKKEGKIDMSDKEKFEGFKKNIVEENESKYGNEIREKYGNDTVNDSNNIIMKMSEADYLSALLLSEELNANLKEAHGTGDPSSDSSQKAVELHRKWLSYYTKNYSKEYHIGLGEMYVEDKRFKAYYDEIIDGGAEFLRDAIYVYTGIEKNK